MTLQKYNKAKSLAKIGIHHETFDILSKKVNESMYCDQLTALQIAQIVDLMYMNKGC